MDTLFVDVMRMFGRAYYGEDVVCAIYSDDDTVSYIVEFKAGIVTCRIVG